MLYGLLTELVVLVHFAFLVFVLAGGILQRRYRWILMPHLLAVAWGVYVEAMPGMHCPLTTLENILALRAGGPGYQGGFIAHHLLPILYPEGLPPAAQWALAAAVILINAAIYAWPRPRVPGAEAPHGNPAA